MPRSAFGLALAPALTSSPALAAPSVAEAHPTVADLVATLDHVALSTDFNSRADISKIWSGNFLRVWAAAQRAAAK